MKYVVYRTVTLYISFNLKTDADAVLSKVRLYGDEAHADLSQFQHSITITNEEMDNIIRPQLQGDIQDILMRLACRNIPLIKEVEDFVLKLSIEHPLLCMVTNSIQDYRGRIIAKIGPLSEDKEGHILSQIDKNTRIKVTLMGMVIDKLKELEKLSKEDVIYYIKKCPSISSERYVIIDRALEAYFQNDYMVFIHLIIPQIEEAVRNLLESNGGNVMKIKNDTYQLRPFDDILRDSIVEDALGKDLATYFRVLFTDARGWNLRNIVCHGIINSDSFNQNTANILLHALLCIGLLRYKEE